MPPSPAQTETPAPAPATSNPAASTSLLDGVFAANSDLPAGRPEPSYKPAVNVEGLRPEKYKSDEDWRKGYDNLSSMIGKTREEIAAAMRPEIEADLFKNRLESKEAYVVPQLEDARIDPAALAEHPLVDWWRDVAFTKGLSQEDFDNGVKQYVSALGERVPDAKAEMGKLGENAKPRIEAVGLWANKTFQGDELESVYQMASTAAGVKALERLMRVATNEPGSGNEVMFRAPGDDEATILKLMNTREYFSPAHRDPKIVQRVQNFYSNQYGAK